MVRIISSGAHRGRKHTLPRMICRGVFHLADDKPGQLAEDGCPAAVLALLAEASRPLSRAEITRALLGSRTPRAIACALGRLVEKDRVAKFRHQGWKFTYGLPTGQPGGAK